MRKFGQKGYIPNFNPASKAKLGNQMPVGKSNPPGSGPIKSQANGAPKVVEPMDRHNMDSRTIHLFQNHSGIVKEFQKKLGNTASHKNAVKPKGG